MYSSDDTARVERIVIYVGVALAVIAGVVAAVMLGFAGHSAR
ncbi:MAG TPA: hypothetical protein VFE10_03550 [Phenylobacterium sp.]|jgi:hypothetical protein|nr:hypothetical protein [Phenylobacterium sp.]